MRYMVIIKANKDSEAGKLPSMELLNEMGKFNAELVEKGIMVDGGGLRSSAEGKRVVFDDEKRSVVDGPFAETKELIAGYWILELPSIEEAVEWVKRVPNTDGGHSEIEIRRLGELSDFEEYMTPEMQEQERALGERLAEQQQRPTAFGQ
ncbi:MAG: YciI family protein [Dehalococcoidia bacterium]